MSDAPGLPILYSFRRCPYAIRARLALKASGVSVELREVQLRNKPGALIAASAKGTVPVLQLPDGAVLEQSLDIMRWALAQHDPQGWVRAEEHDEVCSLIDVNDGVFKQALDRYKYGTLHPEQPVEVHRDAAVALLLPLNERLAHHRFFLRDTPSIADIAIVPFVRQFSLVDPTWFAAAPLPGLRSWMNGITTSPLFEATMTKFTPWQPGRSAPVF